MRPLPGTRTWVESAGQAHSVHSLCPCWQGASFVMFLRWKFMHTDKMIVFVCTRIDWLEWKIMATRMIPTFPKVDCTVEQNLCHQLGVSGYPTIRMYPRGSKGFCTFEVDVFFWWDRCRRQSLPAVSWEQKRRNLTACLATGNQDLHFIWQGWDLGASIQCFFYHRNKYHRQWRT